MKIVPFGLITISQTTPVALAAYAAAGIAGANPFKTGNTAFRLASAKALVPFVFVYSPAMLIITEGFTWQQFILTTGDCTIGIVFLGAALTGYFLTTMGRIERAVTAIAALLLVAPGAQSSVIGLSLMIPILLSQIVRKRKTSPPQKKMIYEPEIENS